MGTKIASGELPLFYARMGIDMTAAETKSRKQQEAEEQLERGLKDSFPASDPPAATTPAAEDIIPPGAGIPPRKREEKVLTDRKLTEREKKDRAKG